jgi:cellulose synthase/poly-beta-1,6-N-acetylglucosamine synthase-like glycosyltransferase
MMVAVWLVLCVYVVIQLIHVCKVILLGVDKHKHPIDETELPEVSVLVAARNEEENIVNCVTHLLQQNYPEHLLHIYVGDDQSTDNTAALVKELTARYPNVHLVSIHQTLGQAKGKANVLAHLAKQAKGSVFFITDADITVQPNWIRTMLPYFTANVGIVSGTTIVQGKNFLGHMQHIDWLYFMDLLLTFNWLGLKSTAVGNNMAITREAYEKTGGYEAFPFSVTEDFMLFKQVRKHGFETVNMLHPQAVNFSAAAPTWQALLHQRKRWLTGAQGLPPYWWLLFAVFALYFPAIFILAVVSWPYALCIVGLKWLLQTTAVMWREKQVNLHTTFFYLVAYEFYALALTLATALFFIIPVKFNWKNRYY